MNRYFLILQFMGILYSSHAQTIQLLNTGTKASFRGLSVVNDHVIWVSGSNGTVGKSSDGGNTWQWKTIKGYEKTDFRDIEAFDDKKAIIMGIESPSVLLKTIDGGETWKVVFIDSSKGMFLDAMDFKNKKNGIVIGDPINGRIFLCKGSFNDNSWKIIDSFERPLFDSGEACFASSGTNIRLLGKNKYLFISGGKSSHLYYRGKKIYIPIIQGTESTGGNSIAVKNKKHFIIVGGDFMDKENSSNNIAITTDGGITWKKPIRPPKGYRSSIEYIQNGIWVTCGLTGVDISFHDGNDFSNISNIGFHVCRKAKKGKAVFFAGGGGRIGKLTE